MLQAARINVSMLRAARIKRETLQFFIVETRIHTLTYFLTQQWNKFTEAAFQ